MKKILIAVAVLSFITPATLFAGDGEGGKGKEHKMSPDKHAKMLEKFDADGDGVLSEDERAAAKAAHKARKEQKKADRLKKCDTDGDGVISDEEKAAAKAAGKAGKKGGKDKKAQFIAEFDLDGDGVPEDMNGDGVVDTSDRAWVLTMRPSVLWELPADDGLVRPFSSSDISCSEAVSESTKGISLKQRPDDDEEEDPADPTDPTDPAGPGPIIQRQGRTHTEQ